MKIRNGYVSNSSSSSFIIHNLDKLSDKTVDKIVHYDERCYQHLKKNGVKFRFCGKGCGGMFGGQSICPDVEFDSEFDFGSLNDGCRWNITINKEKNCIELDTMMTNFDMYKWLEFLGVEYEVIEDDGEHM